LAVRTQRVGQFTESSYFDNVGGLNISDSPFKVLDTQATGGINFQYTTEGAIQKRLGHAKINETPDTQLLTRGIDVYNTTMGVKTLIRAAGTKVQAVDTTLPSFTDLTRDDSSASSDVFPANTSTPTILAPYNTDTVSLLNFVGNTDDVYSIYSNGKFTKNGVPAPQGTMSTSILSASGGQFQTTGTFAYSVAFTKASTGAESNASLDVVATISNTTDRVLLSFGSITSVDTTTYTGLNVYRSSVGGSEGFTTGDLIAELAWPIASYTDNGDFELTTQNIPRANFLILDKSDLPTGTYGSLTLWKRRLVTATGSTVRFSELNSPESWPTVNTITVPTGGPITGLAVIAFNTDFGNDEYLAVFKEREIWLIRGNDYTDVSLSFIDSVGCPSQSLINLANGFLTWIDYQGAYLWDGAGKPISISKTVETLFAIDGDIDKTVLAQGCSFYLRATNTVGWYLTSKTFGAQKICLKVDLRLSLPGVESSLSGRVLPAVFIEDQQPQTISASRSYIPSSSSQEALILGDNEGFLYNAYSVYADGGEGIDFQYYTPFLDLGQPSVSKRYNQVIVWVDEIGDWDLTLDYWAGYRAALLAKSTLVQPISTIASNQTALWDVAFWDEASWDDFTPRLRGIVYNLNNDQGNMEGDCVRLRFRNGGANNPITIHGFTVKWSEIAGRK